LKRDLGGREAKAGGRSRRVVRREGRRKGGREEGREGGREERVLETRILRISVLVLREDRAWVRREGRRAVARWCWRWGGREGKRARRERRRSCCSFGWQ